MGSGAADPFVCHAARLKFSVQSLIRWALVSPQGNGNIWSYILQHAEKECKVNYKSRKVVGVSHFEYKFLCVLCLHVSLLIPVTVLSPVINMNKGVIIISEHELWSDTNHLQSLYRQSKYE